MIKANELRIGNIVIYLSYDEASDGSLYGTSESTVVDVDELKHIEDGPEFYAPIPLTPEILEKCGFTFDGPLAYNGIRLSVYYSMWDNSCHTLAIESPFGTTRMQFVHQLQNWVFALTGEELEVKL